MKLIETSLRLPKAKQLVTYLKRGTEEWSTSTVRNVWRSKLLPGFELDNGVAIFPTLGDKWEEVRVQFTTNPGEEYAQDELRDHAR